MRRITSLALAIAVAMVIALPAIALTRDQSIANTNPFRDVRWTMSSRNVTNRCYSTAWVRTPPHAVGATVTGMAYNWGGFTGVQEFRNGIAGTVYAGNICTSSQGNPYGLRPNTAGIDCSGLISRAWALSSKLGTYQVSQVTVPVRDGYTRMRPGDVFVKSGVHVAMLVEKTSNGPRVVEATGSPYYRVVNRVASLSYFSGYEVRRYPSLQDAGIARLVTTYGPGSVQRDTTFTVRVNLREHDGNAIRYDELALAVLKDTGAFVKDLQKISNVAFTGDQSKSVYFTGTAPHDVGTYRLVVRGRIGSRWTDLTPMPPAINGVAFTVWKPWWQLY